MNTPTLRFAPQVTPSGPTKVGRPVGKLEPFLAAPGQEVIEKLGPTETEARKLTLADGTIAGKAPLFFSLVHARAKVY